MHQAANTYARVAKTGQSGRETEASVLLNAAARLQAVCENWDDRKGELGGALTYNRRVWTILSTAVTADDNALPENIKQNIVNLALFIFKRTFETMAEPAPEKLKSLISINREIAAGLRAAATPTTAAPALQSGRAA